MDESIIVESGIPIPARRNDSSTYANLLRAMKIGDSFVASRKEQMKIRNAAQNGYTRRCRISIRKIDADNIRVWRIE